MHARASAAALLFACSLFACGDGEETPPLDELALRDTLLAEPSVIAQLRPDVRQRLRARFVAERLRMDATTEIAAQGTPLANEVLVMDAKRFAAGRDALITGTWQHADQNTQLVQAVAFTSPCADHPQTTLPPMSGDMSGETILMEQRALEGEAGAIVEQLLKVSGGQRVERVLAWPIAALAASGTVYVNASWLVAMDTQQTSCGSNSGGGGSNPGAGGQPVGAQGGSYMYLVGGEGVAAAAEGSGGESSEESDGQGGVNRASGFGSCDLGCSSSADSCSNACNNTSNSCNSAADNCSYCNDPTGDKACCRACSMTAMAPRSPNGAYGALFWLLMPLGFLAFNEGRGRRLRQVLSRVRGGGRS